MLWKNFLVNTSNIIFFIVIAVIAVSGCANFEERDENNSLTGYNSFELDASEALTFMIFENVFRVSGETGDKTYGIYIKGKMNKYCLTADESGVNKITFNSMIKPFFCDDSFIKREKLNYKAFNPESDRSNFKVFIGEKSTLLVKAEKTYNDKWKYSVRSMPTSIQHLVNTVSSDKIYLLDGYIAKRILSAQNLFNEIENWPDAIKSRAVARPQNIAEAIQNRLSSMSDDEIKSGIKKIAKAYERILHVDGFFGIFRDRFRSHIKDLEKAKNYLLLMYDYVDSDIKRKAFEESLISLIKPENIWEVKNCRKVSQYDQRDDVRGFLGLSRIGSYTRRIVKLSCVVDIREDTTYKPKYKYKLQGYATVDSIEVLDNKITKKDDFESWIAGRKPISITLNNDNEVTKKDSYTSDFVLWEGKPVSITFNIDNMALSRAYAKVYSRLKSYNVYTPIINNAVIN